MYLFNRETFFSEPERWASELREEVVLPPPLDCESYLVLSREVVVILRTPLGGLFGLGMISVSD